MIVQQEKLLNKLKNNLPVNLLLIGQKYSGKKTLVNEIAPNFYWVEGKVDIIRQITEFGNYVFADIDDWSAASYSAMLYLLENNTEHIILTCKNIANLPNSIISRCTVEKMEPYKNIGRYCDNIGQLQFVSDEMIKDVDKYIYKEDYDLDVYFSVLCNRLLYRIKQGENLKKEYLISSKFNAIKSTKSLNKKQFVVNWNLCMSGLSDEWKRL